jgi:hypothetical protein
MRQKIEGPTKKLTVILEATLHSRAKRLTLIKDMTLTELVVTALEERLAADAVNSLNLEIQVQTPSH